MPQLNAAPPTKKDKPFVNTDILTITTRVSAYKIVGFDVTYKGVAKSFDVKKFNILEAWKLVELWLKDVK